MATKLKEVELTSVDFVEHGANQDAYFKLLKKRDDNTLWKQFKAFMKGEEAGRANGQDALKDESLEYTAALNESLESILSNGQMDMEQQYSMIKQSLQEFNKTMEESIEAWRDQNLSTGNGEKTTQSETEKRQEEDEKNKGNEASDQEFESLRQNVSQLKKSSDLNTMREIAKKYTLLGKKEEALAETLYEMKKSGQGKYDQYLSLLDENLSLVEKGGLFTEIGKSGNQGAYIGSDTESKIRAAAAEMRKNNPGMSQCEAIERAWEMHPELAAEYEQDYLERR